MSRAKDKLDEIYWQRIRAWGKDLNSDGCSWVSDIFLDCCVEHDCHYRSGHTIWNKPISRAEADRRFRLCIQSRSALGKYSPISWIRWLGVRCFGFSSYKDLTRS